MAKPKISQDAALEAAIDVALSLGRSLTFGGIDPSASGLVGLARVDVVPGGSGVMATRNGRAVQARVVTAYDVPNEDPWQIAGTFLAGIPAAHLTTLTCEEQFIGAGPAAAIKIIEARARLLYAFELRGRKCPHTMLRAAPSSWQTRVLGSRRWTREEVKPAAARFASNLAGFPLMGDAADALGLAVHTLSRFFTIDLGRFR